jgi:peptide/nickel transport system permease protein
VSAYLVRRLLSLIPVWLGLSLLAFGLSQLTPGDPAEQMLSRETGEPPTIEAIEALREELGLNDPLLVQYGRWLLRVVQGDLGVSFRYRQPVLELLATRFPATLEIAVGALLVSLAIALPAGALAALKRNSSVDHLARLGALLGASLPSFWLGYLLMLALAVELRLLPVAGRGSFRHLVLPCLTLGLGAAAIQARLVRSSMLEVLGEDYIRSARAKGLAERAVVLRHALRNALIPLITVAGLRFAALLGGTVVIETVFAWPGVGKLVVDSIFDRDYPMIQGYVLFTGTVFVLINLSVDLLYRWFDPRIRYVDERATAHGTR